MRRVVCTGLASLILGTLAAPVRAEMSVYYHVGSSDAFSGQAPTASRYAVSAAPIRWITAASRLRVPSAATA